MLFIKLGIIFTKREICESIRHIEKHFCKCLSVLSNPESGVNYGNPASHVLGILLYVGAVLLVQNVGIWRQK